MRRRNIASRDSFLFEALKFTLREFLHAALPLYKVDLAGKSTEACTKQRPVVKWPVATPRSALPSVMNLDTGTTMLRNLFSNQV
jgi:hypothetical protein